MPPIVYVLFISAVSRDIAMLHILNIFLLYDTSINNWIVLKGANILHYFSLLLWLEVFLNVSLNTVLLYLDRVVWYGYQWCP